MFDGSPFLISSSFMSRNTPLLLFGAQPGGRSWGGTPDLACSSWMRRSCSPRAWIYGTYEKRYTDGVAIIHRTSLFTSIRSDLTRDRSQTVRLRYKQI
jgi:hypothetical protein